MKRIIVLATITAMIITATMQSVGESLIHPKSALEGRWVIDSKARDGLKRIEINGSDKSWTIHVWTFATFTEIDWGSAPLTVYGSGVTSKTRQNGLAMWKRDFAQTYMTLRLVNKQLVVEVFTMFADKSGRSNYREVERFRRLQ